MAQENEIAALAARAIGLAEAATETQKKIIAQQGRARRTARLLFVSVALDVTLSVFCVFLAVGQAHTTAAIHNSQLTACATGNAGRHGQIQLWDHVIAVSAPAPHETPAQRAARLRTLASFRAYVAHLFHPLNCARLYRS